MIYQGQFKVTSRFGVRVLNGEWDDHNGIDVVGITDKLIRAVVAGVVVSSTIRDAPDEGAPHAAESGHGARCGVCGDCQGGDEGLI